MQRGRPKGEVANVSEFSWFSLYDRTFLENGTKIAKYLYTTAVIQVYGDDCSSGKIT